MAQFDFKTNALGKHYWILRDGNNETIADAQQGDGYENERDARQGADVFTDLGHDAPRREIPEGASTGANPEFEYFESAKNKQWYWRFRAKNGRVVADGSEGYASRSNVTRAIDNVQTELAELRRIGGSETPPSDSPYA